MVESLKMSSINLYGVIMLVGLALVNSKAISDLSAKKYLQKFGYVSTFSEKLPVPSKKIKIFQEYANIKATGLLDEATKKKMEESRCGMSDEKLFEVKVKRRARRYVHQGTNWKQRFRSKGKMELRWVLLNKAAHIRYNDVLKVFRQAVYYWHQQTDIDFVEVPLSDYGTPGKEEKDVEILVSFVRGWHTDPYAFDGPGGTLAHAFYPNTNTGFSGDVHFDDDEYFTVESKEGKNLLWVATHELGHSIGLEHSRTRDAVMYPWYTGYKEDMKLTEDDILGIQTLYGSRGKPPPLKPGTKIPTTTTTDPTVYDKGVCPKAGKITAVYYSKLYKQEILFTDQNKVLFLGFSKRIPTISRYNYYPKSKVPGMLNAMFTLGGFKTVSELHDEYQFIFNDGNGRAPQYEMYRGFSRVRGGFSIYDGTGPLKLRFPSYVKRIDAVYNAVFNDRTYFFSGTQYWRYNNKKKRFDANYPKDIKRNWRGLPSTVDAAYSSPDKKTTYFFAEGKFYLFDDERITVKAVYPIERFLRCNNVSPLVDVTSKTAKSNYQIGSIGVISDEPKEP